MAPRKPKNGTLKNGAPLSRAELDQLVDAAARTREQAYAPYSRFKVGAAVLSKTGRVYTGCNVENSSYGLALCAERSAIAAAVAAGDGPIVAASHLTRQ